MTVLLLAALAACGKKAPPLAPLRVPPGPIADLALTKVGDQVQARFTLPLINDDKTQPVDIVAAELYALSGELHDATGGPLSGGDFTRYAKLAGRVDVKPLPKAGAEAPPRRGGRAARPPAVAR